MSRRALVWVSACVLALSLGAWGASLFSVGWGWSSGIVGLTRGTFVVRSGNSPDPVTVVGWYAEPLSWSQRWWPWGRWKAGLIVLPIWPMTLAAGATLGCVLLRARRRGVDVHPCAGCGYDLASMLPTCPECGRRP